MLEEEKDVIDKTLVAHDAPNRKKEKEKGLLENKI